MLSACAGPGASPPDRVRVSAAVSLTGPLERVAGAFQRDTGTAVELNLAGSITLAAQILAGAPVDLFISADERQMDRVAAEALIDGNTGVVLLSNRLAVVVPAGAPTPPGDAGALRAPGFRRIAIGDPAGVPAGVYTRSYLASLGLWDALAPRVVPTRSVRAALAVVEAGDADAGIVYQTDARSSDEVAVAFGVPGGRGAAHRVSGGGADRRPEPGGGGAVPRPSPAPGRPRGVQASRLHRAGACARRRPARRAMNDVPSVARLASAEGTAIYGEAPGP